ncbi:hypothetical protein [Burkholderia multivorans]|uniref:hypothetical protein n=1 Tax=Burkholderia multivorans TaxID=87883 RepID=UPI00350F621F
MKREEKMKKAAMFVVATSMAAFLAACGGGGGDGGSASGGSSGGGGSTPTPVQQNATDPYTGQPAAGTATNQISGAVMNGATSGATVTVYNLNEDGTNGDAIGSAITDTSGAFTISLRQAPTGMIRIIATGGTFTSEADASTQNNATLELVAPYVTTALNTFVVTPVTHYASQRISYLAKHGQSLLSAYKTASSAAISVVNSNLEVTHLGRCAAH